jgi:hypothetical protein
LLAFAVHAEQGHSDHKLGINLAVKRRKPLAQASRYPRHNWIDPAQQMGRWNAPFEIEEIE